jgi:hypothetical protein
LRRRILELISSIVLSVNRRGIEKPATLVPLPARPTAIDAFGVRV